MKSIQLIISISALTVISCKPPQQAGEATSNQPQISNSPASTTIAINEAAANPVITPDQAALSSQDTSYRLIISFISIGEGTDRNGKEMIDATLNNWKTSQKKEIHYEEIHWGREGEVDFCFSLSELNEAQQKQFVNEMKEKFKGHDLVQFAENEPCRHKR